MLVGREGVTEELVNAVAAGHSVAVVGEAGVGKTALVRQAMSVSGRRMFEAGALATLTWMPYLPIKRVLRHWLPAGDDVFVASELRHTVGDGVLFLDDLQWADTQTRALLPLITGRVSIVAAVRRGEPDAGAVLEELERLGFERLNLEPLADPQARLLLKQLRPDLSALAARGIVEQAGGNAFLIEELAAHGGPTESLRLALAARLRRLGAPARRSMSLLSLAGRPLEAAVLGEGAHELAEAGLAMPADGGLTVRHALLAETSVAELDEEERRLLHATLARLLDAPGEVARHHAAAGEKELARAAAMRAAEATAYAGERARHLALAASCTDGPEAVRLRLDAANALIESHDHQGLDDLLADVRSGDHLVQAEAHLLRYQMLVVAMDFPAARQAWRRGIELAAGSGSDIETRLRVEEGRIAFLLDQDPRAVDVAESGYRLARRRRAHMATAQYILGSTIIYDSAQDPRWRSLLQGAVKAARREGEQSVEFRATNNLVMGLLFSGDLERARAVADEAEALARDQHRGRWERRMAAWLVAIDWHEGELGQAVKRGESLIDDVSEVFDQRLAMKWVCHALIDLGRYADARRLVDPVVADTAPAPGSPQDGILEVHGEALTIQAAADFWAGRPTAALSAAERAIRFFSPASPSDTRFVGHIVAAWARLELGLPVEATPAYFATRLTRAAPAEIDGVQQLALGLPAAAARFEGAAALWRTSNFGGYLRCRWAHAEALRREGQTTAAIRLLKETEGLADEHGYAGVLVRVQRSLRLAGVRRASRRRTDGRLTARERELLVLVSEGLNNREISRRLGISTSTVKRIIETAASKLGASSRGQAAAIAGRDRFP